MWIPWIALQELHCATSCAVALITAPEPTHHFPAAGWPGYSCSAQLHNARMAAECCPRLCKKIRMCTHAQSKRLSPATCQDKLTGQTRQSRSERQEVQDASRRAEDGQGPEALAQQLEKAPEAEQHLLVRTPLACLYLAALEDSMRQAHDGSRCDSVPHWRWSLSHAASVSHRLQNEHFIKCCRPAI